MIEKILTRHAGGRTAELHVLVGDEVYLFAFRHLQHQLLDEIGDRFVGHHSAGPAPYVERLGRQIELEVRLEFDLAGQSRALQHIAAGLDLEHRG